MNRQEFEATHSLMRIFQGDYLSYKQSLPRREWVRSDNGWVGYDRTS